MDGLVTTCFNTAYSSYIIRRPNLCPLIIPPLKSGLCMSPPAMTDKCKPLSLVAAAAQSQNAPPPVPFGNTLPLTGLA